MNPIIRIAAAVLMVVPLATVAKAERNDQVTAATSTVVKPAEVVVPPHGPHSCIGWRRYCHNR